MSLSHRRQGSSLDLSPPSVAKAGIYGTSPLVPPQSVTFAPNVTPISYSESDGSPEPLSPSVLANAPTIFPPAESTSPVPSRRRCPPGRRRSQGYVPRPPNAFMLFRADFVRMKHVPGTVETSHGTLSKIIGNCWRALPLKEKEYWDARARIAKSEHKVKYPNYRFRPVHNKEKRRAAASVTAAAPFSRGVQPVTKSRRAPASEEEDRRCEHLAQFLLEGKRGNDLIDAVKKLDLQMRYSSTRNVDNPSSAVDSPTLPSVALPQVPSMASLIQPPYISESRRASSVPLPSDLSPNYPYPTVAGTNFNFPYNAIPSYTPPHYAQHQDAMTHYQPFRQSQANARVIFGFPDRRASSARPDLGRDHHQQPYPITSAGLIPTGTESTESIFNSWSFPNSADPEDSLASTSQALEFPVDPLWVDTSVQPPPLDPNSATTQSSFHSRTPSSTSTQSYFSSSSCSTPFRRTPPALPLGINVGLANGSHFPADGETSYLQQMHTREALGLYAPQPKSATQAVFPDYNFGVGVGLEVVFGGGQFQDQDLDEICQWSENNQFGTEEQQQHQHTTFDAAMDINSYGTYDFDTLAGMGIDMMNCTAQVQI